MMQVDHMGSQLVSGQIIWRDDHGRAFRLSFFPTQAAGRSGRILS